MEHPDNIGKSVTELCEMAEITRTSYYRMMKKQEFLDFIQVTALDHVKGELLQLWNAAAKHGKQGNFQYWKALMDATGQYTEKQRIEVEVSGKLEDYF